ncbi:MAG: AAA family ATPase [Planctomycetota bacterium]
MPRTSAVSLASAFAHMEARAGGFAEVQPDHLWLGLCRVAEVVEAGRTDRLSELTPAQLASLEAEGRDLLAWFAHRRMRPADARRAVRDRLHPQSAQPPRHELSEAAAVSAILAAAASLTDLADRVLADASPLLQGVLVLLAAANADPSGPAIAPAPTSTPAPAPAPKAASGAPATLPPLIASLGRDLTKLGRAGQLPLMVGRKAELKRLALALSQQRKNCPMLIGEPGVGKTQIAWGLAALIASPKCPPHLRDVCLVEIQPAALIAGTGMRGDLEKRIEQLLKEAASDRRIVLFIDEAHSLLGIGRGEGSLDIANMIKPALANGTLRMVGATTTEEYERIITADPALERRFESVMVDEPDRDEAVAILHGLSGRMQQHYALAILPEAIDAAVDLAIRFDTSHRLPDKAIDLLDQACAARALGSFSVSPEASSLGRTRDRGLLSVDRESIVDALVERLRLPRELVTADDMARVRWLEQTLGDRVMGQTDAVAAISGTLRASYRGLRSPRRPIATFLFHGPTGVGKTESARALAEILFGDADRLVRLDMSEYGEKHEIARLLGAPPGYQGHDQPGQLSVPLRNTPACVVLFDEIEKAHPDVLQLLLQVLDEGELTDSRGRKLRFRETVIVLTTNLVPKTDGAPEDAFRPQLKPELLGRISCVVPFHTPGKSAMQAVAQRVLARLADRLQVNGQKVELPASLADEALRAMGDSPAFGVRELEHRIERVVAAHLEELSVQRRAAVPGPAGTSAASNDAIVPPGALGDLADGMLRSDAGGVYQLRARPVMTIGRHEGAGWMALLWPRTPENVEASRAIGRQHVLVRASTLGFSIEDLGSSTGTVVGHMALAPGVVRELPSDGTKIEIGRCLSLRARPVPDRHIDIRDAASTMMPAVREHAIGYGQVGPFRSLVLTRLNNRPEECCVCVVKYACIGSAADCEVVVAGTAPVAAELRAVRSGTATSTSSAGVLRFRLAALVAGLRLNDRMMARGEEVQLSHEDTLTLPGSRERLVYLQRPASMDGAAM